MASLQALVAFAETARHGNFAAAARNLGLTASAVAKSVARLEQDLGLRLFHRTTRKVALTGDGQSLFTRCRRVLDEMEAIREEAEGSRRQPTGTLRLNLPITYGKKVVVPVLARLCQRYPDLALDLSFSDHRVDLIAEGFDAVVRIGMLDDSRLVARPIGTQTLAVVASPTYLARHGTPRAPADLDRHSVISFRLPVTGRLRPWQFATARRSTELESRSRFVLDEGEAVVAAAAAGLGLAQVPAYMADQELRSGRLVEILTSHRPVPLPISLLYPTSRQVPQRLRVLIDALAKRGAK
jgi:DNA-binding transcriptional LysR family regulator